jgi:hypothetical protein
MYKIIHHKRRQSFQQSINHASAPRSAQSPSPSMGLFGRPVKREPPQFESLANAIYLVAAYFETYWARELYSMVKMIKFNSIDKTDEV